MSPIRALAVALGVFATLPALAQTPLPGPPPPAPYPYYANPYPYIAVAPGVYFTLMGGALLPNDVTVKGGGTIGGVPATGSGRAQAITAVASLHF